MKNQKIGRLMGAAIGMLISGWSSTHASPELGLQFYAGIQISGKPGTIYSIESTTDPTQVVGWKSLSFLQLPATNYLFIDSTGPAQGNRFYRAVEQASPTNMVFVPPTTFMMGSPESESGRGTNEGPQTRVILSRGFWIGKYEVTQEEFLSVTGTNPSVFPNDLHNPVSSVSWSAATNYCWLLTQREQAAGSIPIGSQFRLPTEAEWECAARAGTSTRFSFGDDLEYTNLANHAWTIMNGGFTVHPVGQKLPNPWGLYDIEGNVWEWVQDWLGPLPGGTVIDPQGPPSNSIGWRVIRGGGYDFGESDCRSAKRYFFGDHPALTDSNLGFRVVLASQ